MSSQLDLVSVIITTYNRYKYVQNAIKSVQNQTYPNIEIIVVDDCSTQKEYIDKPLDTIFRNIKLIRLEKNSKDIYGFASPGGHQRNEGIKHAKGKYIAFLDDDDIWFPNKIINQIIGMKRLNVGMSSTEAYYGKGIYIPTKIYKKYLSEFAAKDTYSYFRDNKNKSKYFKFFELVPIKSSNELWYCPYDCGKANSSKEMITRHILKFCKKYKTIKRYIKSRPLQPIKKSKSKSMKKIFKHPILKTAIWDKNVIKKVNTCICSSVVIRSDIIKKAGKFPILNTADDYAYWLKVLEHTKCLYIDKPLVYYDMGHADGQNY